MARKLKTKRGRAVYSRRKAIVEPVFGQIDTVQISLFTQETGAGVSNTCESLTARVNLRNLTF